MKKNVSRILGLVLCLCVFLGSLSLASLITSNKTSYYRFSPFIEHAENYDVLFFGTSHVNDGVFPLQLWEEYGICAYNCATPGSAMPSTYWGVMNALDYSAPKLIVVDCYNIGFPSKNSNIAAAHSLLDAFPLSFTKLRAAWDLGNDAGDYRQALELMFPFAQYHSRWSSLTENDFDPERNRENGATRAVNVVSVPLEELPSSLEPMALNDSMPGVAYLRRLLDTCAQRKIPVLLTYLPFPASLENRQEAAAIEALAKEYNLNYINFLEMQVINDATDHYDGFSHLNPSGGQRITAWLGDFISRNYSLPQRRDDPSYAFMEQHLEDARQYQRTVLAEQSYLSTYLMLLRNTNFSAVIHLPADSAAGLGDLELSLLENIPIGEKPTLLRQAAEAGAEYLLVVDSAAGEIYEFAGELPAGLSCSLGQFRFADGVLSLNDAQYTVPAEAEERVLDCFVFDSASGLHLGLDRSFLPGEGGFVVAY